MSEKKNIKKTNKLSLKRKKNINIKNGSKLPKITSYFQHENEPNVQHEDEPDISSENIPHVPHIPELSKNLEKNETLSENKVRN